MGWMLLGVAAAAGLTTVAFLRPKGAFRPTLFPSLQHVLGSTPRRRRTLALEDVVGWALRLGALGALAAGLLLAASKGQVSPVVVVDPATGASGRAQARGLAASARLGFDAEIPWVEGPLGAWLEPTLRACSASAQRCLARVAARSGRPVVAVGERARGWEGLDEVTQPVAWREVGLVRDAGVAPEPPAVESPPPTVHRRGTSTEGALWAAALESVAATLPSGVHVDVVDADWVGEDDGAPRVVVERRVTPPRGQWPAVARAAIEGVTLSSVGACVTQREAVALHSSLAWAEGEAVVGRVVIARHDGARTTLAAAATAEELGRWAHEGTLTTLALAMLGELREGPARCVGLPPGVTRSQFDAPLGVVDVAPGTYRRADGRVEVELARAPSVPSAAWQKELGVETDRPPAPMVAFLVAAALTAIALARSRRWSLLPGAAALALLGALALDLERAVQRVATPVLRVEAGVMVDAGVRVVSADEPLACERPRAVTPCEVLATVGAAWAPPQHADWLVFDAAAPRLDLVSVRAPSVVPLGSAARLEVTVRVRRARGASLRVVAKPGHGAVVERTQVVGSDDETLQVPLDVVALLGGDEQVVLEASATRAGAPPGQAVDAREVSLRFVDRGRRRVVLAGAPSWEARFAARTLRADGGGQTASLTRVGASAVQAVGLPRADPLRWLLESSHDEVDTLVLTGFVARDLEGRPAQALTAFVRRGGALLFLGGEGVEALGWPSVTSGEGPLVPRAGDLLDGSGRLVVVAVGKSAATLPRGAELLGTLGDEGQPWIIGRAEGEGRVAAVVASELFRLGPPGGEGAAAERALFRAVGWVEASASSTKPWADPTSTPVRRALLRGEAARRGVPFFEPDGEAELGAGLAKRSPAAPRLYPLPVRDDLTVVLVLLGLLVLEAFVRGRRAAERSP